MTWQWSLDGWIVLAGILSACSCALLGNYLVLRKLSLMGDAISHAVLPGLAAAFLIAESRSPGTMFLGAVITGILTAVLTQSIIRYGKVEDGAAMGVVFSVLFAVGLVLIRQAADHVDLDPQCVLYGNIVAVGLDAITATVPPMILHLGIVLILNLLFILLFYKELKICSFDPELATTLGINANFIHYALMVMVAITTVANFEAVGSILVIAMLIVPPSAAHLLTDRLDSMIVWSLVIAAASAVAGHLLAIFGPGWIGLPAQQSINSAAMMAVTCGFFLGLALLLSPQYGLISRLYHRWLLARQMLREDLLGLLYRWNEMNRSGQPLPMTDLLKLLGDRFSTRQAIRTLRRQQAVSLTPLDSSARQSGVILTRRGKELAAQLVRSHRLLESYLAQHLQLPLDHLHAPAERIEHFITPTMQDELHQQTGLVQLDPQGKPIPPKKPAGPSDPSMF